MAFFRRSRYYPSKWCSPRLDTNGEKLSPPVAFASTTGARSSWAAAGVSRVHDECQRVREGETKVALTRRGTALPTSIEEPTSRWQPAEI